MLCHLNNFYSLEKKRVPTRSIQCIYFNNQKLLISVIIKMKRLFLAMTFIPFLLKKIQLSGFANRPLLFLIIKIIVKLFMLEKKLVHYWTNLNLGIKLSLLKLCPLQSHPIKSMRCIWSFFFVSTRCPVSILGSD